LIGRRDKVRYRQMFFYLLVMVLSAAAVSAGPYAPAADEEGTTAVYKDDPAFGFWASGYENYIPRYENDPAELADIWKTPENAVGMATATVTDIVSLGRGGEITLTFDPSVPNRDGWDFAVFENAVTDTFLELAYVEVSSNGMDFVRFDCISLTPGPVNAFGSVDPTNIDGFGGKYKIGYGTPFDLELLSEEDKVKDETVNINSITHIRIVDVIGDGRELYDDDPDHKIFDPYPTTGSAGFDLNAVGVITSEPTIPWPLQNGSTASGGCFIATAAFGSATEPHVGILRDFRDKYLITNVPGRLFVNTYYKLSPPVAYHISKHELLRRVVRVGLLPLVGSSYLMLHTTAIERAAILCFSAVGILFVIVFGITRRGEEDCG
jgi:hypothetical protein